MDNQSLIIPVRFDYKTAAADLKNVEKAGKSAGEVTSRGFKDASSAAKDAGQSIHQSGGELANFLKLQAGFGAFKQAVSTVGSEFKRISDDITKAAKDWQDFRKYVQGNAALSNTPNSDKFAMDVVDRAEKAHVTPKEMASLQEGMLERASLYIGDGKEAKISSEDAAEVQAKFAEYAKSRNVDQKEMGSFVGGLLAQKKGKTNAKDLIAEGGQVFGALEASSAPVSHLLPMTTRAMAQGFSSREAAQKLAMMPEIAPEEEGTYLLRAVSALRETIQKGEGEEFGLKKGMSPNEIIETAVKNIKDRAAKGEDLDDLITKATHGEEVSGRALRGMVNQGPEGFDRWRKVVEGIPDNQIQESIKADRDTKPGRQRAVDSAKAVEEQRMGQRWDDVERRRQIAEVELMKAGRLEHPLAMDYAKGALTANGMLGLGDDMRNQQINRQALARARAELGDDPREHSGDTLASYSRTTTNELLKTLIERIDKQTEVIKVQGGDNGPRPLPDRQPGGGVRGRM
jgi:hypothetical protein